LGVPLNSTKDENPRYVILTGQSLEKREVESILKSIERDKEIKKLIDTSHWFTKYRAPLEVLFAVLFATAIYYLEKEYVTNAVVDIFVFLPLTAAATYLFIRFLDYMGLHWVGNHFQARGEEFPLGPFDMWRPEVSALSDAHNALAAELTTKSGVSMVHSNMPYFKRFFIFSITLKFNTREDWRVAKRVYGKEFKRYAREIVEAVEERRIRDSKNSPDRRTGKTSRDNISWQVFGISFFSRFLFRLSQENSGHKFFFKLPGNFQVYQGTRKWDNSKEDSTDVESCIRELLRLSTSPDNAVIQEGNGQSSTDIFTIEVTEAEINEGRIGTHGMYRTLKEWKSKEMTIPIRRWITVPNVDNQPPGGDRESALKFLDMILERGRNSPGKVIFVGVGGVEHNLSLLYYINRFRWDECEKSWIGIGENRFDLERLKFHAKDNVKNPVLLYSENRVGFRIGTEDYLASKHRDSGLVLHFSLKGNNGNEYEFLSFYGLSGALTGISFLKYLKGSRTEIEGKGAYLFRADPTVNWSDFLDEWDSLDPMNNPDREEVRGLLDKISIRKISAEDEIVSFESLEIVVAEGRIRELVLHGLVKIDLDSYQKMFNIESFNSFKAKVKEATISKESVTLRHNGTVRYGGGHFLILRDETRNRSYAVFVLRDKNAKRDPLLIDLAAGLGDTVNPVETMLRELSEEFLLYIKGAYGSKGVNQIIPSVEGSKYNEEIRIAAENASRFLNRDVKSLIFFSADSLPPLNPTIVRANDSTPMKCGVYFGDESIEFVRTLIIRIKDLELENDLILQDGEHDYERWTDRIMILVNLEDGSCKAYKSGKKYWNGTLQEFLKENGLSESGKVKGRVATVKVTNVIENWDSSWGRKDHLIPLLFK